MLRPVDVDDINSPPTLRSPASARASGRSLDQIVTYDESIHGSTLELPILVSDRDGDTVEGRVFIDYDPDTNTGTAPSLGFQNAPVGRGELLFSIRVGRNDLLPAGRCRKIELLASHAFRPAGDGGVAAERIPLSEGDLTTVIWWVQVVDALNPVVNMADCP